MPLSKARNRARMRQSRLHTKTIELVQPKPEIKPVQPVQPKPTKEVVIGGRKYNVPEFT